MTIDKYAEHRDQADRKRRKKEFEIAGNEYTVAAYTALGKSELRGTADISRGLSCLMSAAVCYRLHNEPARGANRCKQGILIGEDLRDNTFEDDLAQGAMWEHIGDFRTIGGLDGADDAYESARTLYSASGNPMEYTCTEEFDALITIFDRLAKSAGYDTNWEKFQSTHLERINCKTAEFASILETILQEGVWEYEGEQ
jgi:hypothetical protein